MDKQHLMNSNVFSETLQQVNKHKPSSAKRATSYNRNVSSELSKIQDNGPAYLTQPKVNNGDLQIQNTSNKKTNAKKSNTNEIANPYEDEFQSELLSKKLKLTGGTSSAYSGKFSRTIGLSLILVLVITAVMSWFMVDLEVRANELLLSQQELSEKMQKETEMFINHSAIEIGSLKQSLKNIDTELSAIKSGFLVMNKQSDDVTQNSTKETNRQVHVMNNAISELKTELFKLRNELKIVGGRYKSISAHNNYETHVPNRETWVVNLVSLKSKLKAEDVVKKLNAAGLSPQMQEIVVKGERVYRLSVGGFSDRKQAESFMKTADKKFGLENGWIRRG